MKPLLIFAALASALLLLAAVTIGLMVSISSGHPSWLLTGVFAFDTLLLIAVAARLMLGRHVHTTAPTADRTIGRSAGQR